MRLFICLLIVWLSATGCTQKVAPLSQRTTAYVVNGGDKTVDVIDLDLQRKVNSFPLEVNEKYFPHHIYAGPNQEKLVIATPAYDFSKGHDMTHAMNMPGGIKIIDSKNGSELLSIKLNTLNHNALLSPDGKEVWTAIMSHSGKVKVYDAVTGELLSEIQVNSDPSELIFSQDGQYALVACSESTFVNIIDRKTKSVIKKLKVDNYPSNVWEGFGSISLVSNMARKSINFVDTDLMKVVDFIDLDFMPGYVDYNDLTEEIWICNSMMNKVSIFKKKDGKWISNASIGSDGDPHMLKFYEGGKKAILINQKSNTLKFIDATKKVVIKEISISSKPNGISIIDFN